MKTSIYVSDKVMALLRTLRELPFQYNAVMLSISRGEHPYFNHEAVQIRTGVRKEFE